jgi:DNA invertase Pin-like site-specific DNA recombinase
MQVQHLLKAGVKKDDLHVEKVSAASAKRPKLAWAMANLREGDTLVVWKMDRLARSLLDLIGKLKQIEGAGARFRSLTEHIDTNTPGGRLIFHVLGALSEFERDLVVERTRAGVKVAKAAGKKFGVDPKLTPQQVAQAQKMRDNGQSARTIAAKFNVSPPTIYAWTVGKNSRKR